MFVDLDPEAALDLWSAFPVGAAPRPLVVLIGRDIKAPNPGFTNETKDAWCDGAIRDPSAFTEGPATADGFPVISALAAVELVRAAGDGQGSTTTLDVNEMRFGAASFDTDRGSRVLPAWIISFESVPNPAAVLAVAPSTRFIVPGIVDLQRIHGAGLSSDGRTLTVGFTGGAPETFSYAAEVLESRTAVAVRITRTTPVPTGPTEPLGYRRERYHALGYGRDATATLREPLGDRVLVDATTGAPRPVVGAAG